MKTEAYPCVDTIGSLPDSDSLRDGQTETGKVIILTDSCRS